MLHLDAAAGAALKDAGQQLALDFAGDWKDSIVVEFTGWLAIQRAMGLKTITIEQFRAQTRNQPPSHKAWGALPKMLQARGLIRVSLNREGEPRRQRAAAPRTHAHPVLVWEIV